MAKEFISGFLVGLVFKDVFKFGLTNGLLLYHSLKKKTIKKVKTPIESVHFICKVTNEAFFKQTFAGVPVPNSSGKVLLQPNLEYYPKHGIIRSQLDEDLIDYLNKNTFVYSFEEIYKIEELITLDLDFFKKLGEVYIYLNYNTGPEPSDLKFTNIYTPGDMISNSDLVVHSDREFDFGNEIVCARVNYTGGTEYITRYFKYFLNGNEKITPNMVLYNYPYIEKIPAEYIFNIVCSNKMKNYSPNEPIFG